jgi:hypothetical protein
MIETQFSNPQPKHGDRASKYPGPSKIPAVMRGRTRLWLSPEGICFVGSSLIYAYDKDRVSFLIIGNKKEAYNHG